MPEETTTNPASNPTLLRSTLSGLGAGFLATVPMTAVMVPIQKGFSLESQSKIAPRIITEEALERAHVGVPADERKTIALTTLNHFAFGASMGAIYGALKIAFPKRPVASGVSFALLVWFVSYSGWVPALGILPPPSRQSRKRNLSLILSHLVWGACLGSIQAAVAKRRQASGS